MNTTQPVNFIRFHGLTLLVVEHGGVEYIDPRALCELAGMQWNGARRNLQLGDNAVLYCSKLLQRAVFDADGTSRCSTNEALYIRLDRSRLFMARINTAQMKAKGNVEAADTLLTLQIEWAEALHAYETDGVAVKKSHREARTDLIGLIKARTATTNAAERIAITAMIRDICEALGYPLPADPQRQLEGV